MSTFVTSIGGLRRGGSQQEKRCRFHPNCRFPDLDLRICKNCDGWFHHLCASSDDMNWCGCTEDPDALSQVTSISAPPGESQPMAPKPKTQGPTLEARNKLKEKFRLIENESEAIRERAKTCLSLRDDDQLHGSIFEFVCAGGSQLFTNFSISEIQRLVSLSEPAWSKFSGPGPKPKFSLIDHWCLLLMWLKSAQCIQTLAASLSIHTSTAHSMLERIRMIALEALSAYWWSNKQRPVPLAKDEIKEVALLIDSTTIQTFKPLLSFNNSKLLWDGKNHIYGLKKEIAVAATAPHYALFSQPAVAGFLVFFLIIFLLILFYFILFHLVFSLLHLLIYNHFFF